MVAAESPYGRTYETICVTMEGWLQIEIPFLSGIPIQLRVRDFLCSFPFLYRIDFPFLGQQEQGSVRMRQKLKWHPRVLIFCSFFFFLKKQTQHKKLRWDGWDVNARHSMHDITVESFKRDRSDLHPSFQTVIITIPTNNWSATTILTETFPLFSQHRVVASVCI